MTPAESISRCVLVLRLHRHSVHGNAKHVIAARPHPVAAHGQLEPMVPQSGKVKFAKNT
ncbi:hypothetical protein Thiowin_02056 [Thiorhodovibrio winogradskyi]|uniref:Transposase n=1 Tax=Thiorhodovibrio winogradskyi TaxID=77007 RepID=A0ABZ0S962_9GAMM